MVAVTPSFELTPGVLEELGRLENNADIDVVLAPFPVIDAMRRASSGRGGGRIRRDRFIFDGASDPSGKTLPSAPCPSRVATATFYREPSEPCDHSRGRKRGNRTREAGPLSRSIGDKE